MARRKTKSPSASESSREGGNLALRTGGIVPIDINREMRDSYLNYAMSVIVARALPDVRDGLKPVHRRILYAMHEMGLSVSARFRKSAAVVGDVLGKYHPHGDTAVYDALVKLAQPFATRYPLILGQGNFGSIDGDAAAAMRYSEAKMTRLAGEVLRDIEKNTVDFSPNYDATRNEPRVFPTVAPILLLNGTLGIAVGMATRIPPHNLREVSEALVHLSDNPSATTEDLLTFIKGPDFPTGGIIFNEQDIAHAYSSGRGGVLVRGEAEIVENKAGAYQIIITSIPYQINKSEMIIKMADLVHEKKVEGIRDIRDESTEDIRVVIDLKNTAQPQTVLNALYKHTELETMFHFNMVALVDGVPQTLSLKSILEEFLKHRRSVVRRRTEFDLEKALEREHILLGLKKALDHIDQIIKTIKRSKDTSAAHTALKSEFKFTDIQATAILEMKLQRLAGLERQKIEDELAEKQALIKELRIILASEKKIVEIIKYELVELAEKYGDDRRTKVVKHGVKEFSVEDVIADEENVLVLTRGGYIKRTRPDEYRRQRRGGVGVVDLDTKEEDFITMLRTASTHSELLFFSDRGKVYQLKMYEVPEGKRATRGKSVMNFLPLTENERITSVLVMPKSVKAMSGLSVMMVTKQGTTKKVSAESLKDVRRSGIIAIKLSPGDELLSTLFVEKGDTVILATANGQGIRFKESDIREMGRQAGGVRGMKLRKSDLIVGADRVRKEESDARLMVMSENGFGKSTALKEYKVQKRGGSGVKTAKVTAKTGKLMVSRVLSPEYEEVVAISRQSQVIKVLAKEVPTLGRQTQGVRIMKLRPGDSIASLTCL